MSFGSLSQRVFSEKHSIDRYAICPTMDVVLMRGSSEGNKLSLHRVAGQSGRVWQSDHSQPVSDYCWSPDGHLIASTSQDRSLDLLSVHTGSPVISLTPPIRDDEDLANATYRFEHDSFLAWHPLSLVEMAPAVIHTQRLTNCLPALPNLANRKKAAPSNNLLTQAYGMMPKAAVAVEKITLELVAPNFPRLPAPFVSAEEATSTFMPTLLLHQPYEHDIRLLYAGCFEIGYIQLPTGSRTLWTNLTPGPDRCDLSVIWQEHDLHVRQATVTVDMPLRRLEHLTRTASAVHQHLKYVYDSISESLDQWQEAKATGAKWHERVIAAGKSYHLKESSILQMMLLLLTGRGTEALTECLTLKNAERDFDKWESSFTESMTNLRDAAYQCVTPAIERIVLWLEEMRGQALVNKKSPIGPHPKVSDIERCLKIAQLIIVRTEDMEVICDQWQRKFAEFVKWMKFENDLLTAKDQTGDNKPVSKHDVVWVADVLNDKLEFTEINNVLARDGNVRTLWDLIKPEVVDLEADKREWEQMKEDLRQDKPIKPVYAVKPANIPGLPYLLKRLTSELGSLFSASTRYVNANVSIQPAPLLIFLPKSINIYFELRVRQVGDTTFILSRWPGAGQFYLSQVQGQQPLHLCFAHALLSEIVLEVVDIDFFDDLELAIAAKSQNEGLLATVDYIHLDWSEASQDMALCKAMPLQLRRYHPLGSQLIPSAMALNGRPGRRIGAILGTESQLEVFDMEEVPDQSDDVEMDQ